MSPVGPTNLQCIAMSVFALVWAGPFDNVLTYKVSLYLSLIGRVNAYLLVAFVP